MPQHEGQQEPRRPRQSEDNSSIGHWLKKIGFEVSSEDSRDLDAELEAIMRGHASVNPITRMGSRIRQPKPKQDPILEEENECEGKEDDDEEEGLSIGGSKEDEAISLDREVCPKVDKYSPPSNYSKFDLEGSDLSGSDIYI